MKEYILIFISLLTFSCNVKNKECQGVIDAFDFPKDLTDLENKHYICNDHVNLSKLLTHNLTTLFADKNYELIRYNTKIRLLIDKKEKMSFVFKTIESEDFSVNKINKKENREYGIYEIYLVDLDFKPIYSIMKDSEGVQSLIKYENIQDNSFLYENVKLISKEMPHINTMSYKDLTSFFFNLCNSDYYIRDRNIVNINSNKPIWDEY